MKLPWIKVDQDELTLLPDQVHIWRLDLRKARPVLDALKRYLTNKELARVQRYHFPADRERALGARGLLRVLCCRYLRCKNQALQFGENTYGKPHLVMPQTHEPFNFNLTHSGDFVLAAFAWGRAVGIDVEPLRRIEDAERLVERFFSPQEVASFFSVSPELRDVAFLNGWTRKEAFIKAHGEGISLGLDKFDVCLHPERPAALLGMRLIPDETNDWLLQALNVDDAYLAALAVHGHDWKLLQYEFEIDPNLLVVLDL